MKPRTYLLCFVLVLAGLAFSCSEVNRQTSPVELVATVAQDIHTVDLADTQCGSLGTITIQSIVKRTDVTDIRFLDVKLSSMKVSYQRTDGGTLVPAPLTETLSDLITANGGSTTLNDFIVFDQAAFTQAPFAALLPTNGGLDPETGQPEVKMDVVMDIFGKTLAGDDVYTKAQFPLTFCYNCGGCL